MDNLPVKEIEAQGKRAIAEKKKLEGKSNAYGRKLVDQVKRFNSKTYKVGGK